MATELKSSSKHYNLTQYCGPSGPADRRRLQITGNGVYARYFTIGKGEVVAFCKELVQNIKSTDVEDMVNVNGIEMPAISALRLGNDLLDWREDKLVEITY